MNVVLIDDEPLALKSALAIINEGCPGVMVVGMANTLSKGKSLIEETKPDLVLCDIEMPTGTGFDLLDGLHFKEFQLVFVTAYDQYALKAFQYHAVDYLLKPYRKEKLITVVNKIKEEVGQLKYYKAIDEKINLEKRQQTLVVVSHDKTYHFLYSEIKYLLADGNYTKIYATSKPPCLSSKNLKYFQDMLSESMFFRIHHSVLVQRSQIYHYNSSKHQVILNDGNHLKVSHRKSKLFTKWLKESAD